MLRLVVLSDMYLPKGMTCETVFNLHMNYNREYMLIVYVDLVETHVDWLIAMILVILKTYEIFLLIMKI